jgi:serine/threonine-protein kinase
VSVVPPNTGPLFAPPHTREGADPADAAPGAPEVDPRLGATIDGRYRVDRLVGKGGFGRVYEGLHLGLGARVAIKFLVARDDRDVRARCQREAQILAQLQHPGIVHAHDVGEHQGESYLVMEFVDGRSVGELLAQEGPLLARARVLDWVDQVLQVLQAAHAAAVVHRDLKTDNLMVVRDAGGREAIKVLDFGLAFVDRDDAVRLTGTHSIAGTPKYMSPEQCRGRDVGPETDLYAVGVLLYELLTGKPPFHAATLPEVMAQQLYVPAPPMPQRGPGAVPAALEAAVLRALSKDPAARPTAAELRRQLADIQRGADPVTLAASASAARVVAGGLDREQRALPPRASGDDPTLSRAPAGGAQARVGLWAFEPEPARLLRDTLAVNGVAAEPWPVHGVADDFPAVQAVLIAGAGAEAHLQQLRAHPLGRALPALVVEPPGPASTIPLLRAGASDICPAGSSGDEVSRKVWRLLRRGR